LPKVKPVSVKKRVLTVRVKVNFPDLTPFSLRRQIACYLDYYHGSRNHLSLGKDPPEGRSVEPPSLGRIVAVPKVGGLHHRYGRRAA